MFARRHAYAEGRYVQQALEQLAIVSTWLNWRKRKYSFSAAMGSQYC